MFNSILSTTTNFIEGAKIERYIDIISTNIIIGTNLFSDIGASITDIFGGFSNNYQNKLDKIYIQGRKALESKAASIGANAIIGVKIDFDEISGKSKSMFMLSLSGTAVYITNKIEGQIINPSHEKGNISSEMLNHEINKERIINKIKNNILPDQNDWQFLMQYPINSIAESLLKHYIKIKNIKIKKTPAANIIYETEKILDKHFPHYTTLLDKDIIQEILYKEVLRAPSIIINLLSINELFSSGKVINLIKSGENSVAVNCLKIPSSTYNYKDLEKLKEVSSLLDNLKDLGKIENSKNILGKEKEKYFCPKGHENDGKVEFCEHYNNGKCGLNIKGLKSEDLETIKQFKTKISTLESLLNQ